MKHWGTILILLAAGGSALLTAGCTGGRPWESQVEEPEVLPYPPEKLLRKPPDFRLRDLDNRREFFLYFHEDQEYREEVVLVINSALPEPEQRPRLATLDEHEYALRLFVNQWRSRSDEEKLHYFNEMLLQELGRNATLLDQKIRFKESVRKDLYDKKATLEADLKSRKDTGAFSEGSEKFNLISSSALEQEVARTDRQFLQAEVELMVLRHLRAERDAEYGRKAEAVLVTTALPVKHLLPGFSSPQRLADQVRTHVRPSAWDRPMSMIEVRDKHLMIRQTQDVINEVEQYLEKLEEEMESRR
jgi:hypothetical protein